MGYRGPKKSALGVTNLTVLPLQTDYGPFGIEQLTFVPPAVSYTQRVIGAATLCGQLCLTYHLMRDDAQERRFFKQAIDALAQDAGL